MRLQRLSEVFAVSCHRCGREVELPAGAVAGDAGTCPSCRAPITMQWCGGAADYDRERQAKRHRCQQCRRPVPVEGMRFCSEGCSWAARVDRVLELVGTSVTIPTSRVLPEVQNERVDPLPTLRSYDPRFPRKSPEFRGVQR